MSKPAILISTLVSTLVSTLAVAVLVTVPAATEADAKTHHGHVKKHVRHWGPAYSRHAFVAGPAIATPTEPICPQVGHSFDCKIWPPPYADDPDRKTSKH